MFVTTVCMEDSPGYPDPLIYVVEVPVNASFEEIEELVIQERIKDNGEVSEHFRVCLAWPGEIPPYLFDHRF